MARDNGASASAGSTQLATIGTGNAGAIGQTGASTNNGNAASSQAGKRAFMQLASNRTTASTERVTALASANVVQAGSIIPAALITGIRSDLPGQITAQVTQNVYDSPTGRILLIPQGSRLIGEYDSEVAAGQTRVLLAWDRLILPGGRSILLDRQPGGDASGFAGLQDKVNYHWGNMLRAALISTALGVGTEMATDNNDPLVRLSATAHRIPSTRSGSSSFSVKSMWRRR
jgi:type IV secretion system protein VirB10